MGSNQPSFYELADIADRAADYVLDGWCRNSFMDEQGRVCAHGALYAAAFGKLLLLRQTDAMHTAEIMCDGTLRPLRRKLIKIVRESGYLTITTWNDDLHQTAGAVADALRSVAKTFREQACESNQPN